MLLLAQSTAEVTGTSATAETILFWIFATVAVGAGIAVVTMRNIVHAALMLVLNMLSIAGLYLGLQSSFLSIAQVIVYAGAIMVLFLFVIMLLGVDRDDLLTETSLVRTGGAVLSGVVLAAGLLFVLGTDSLTTASACNDLATPGDGTELTCVGLDEALASSDEGSVSFLAESLFTTYTFPFEASALLLVVATLGALVLGRRNDPDAQDPTATAPVPSEEDVEELVAAAAELQGGGRGSAAGVETPGDSGPAAGTDLPDGDVLGDATTVRGTDDGPVGDASAPGRPALGPDDVAADTGTDAGDRTPDADDTVAVDDTAETDDADQDGDDAEGDR